MEPRSQVSGATAQIVGSGAGCRRQGAANPKYPGLAQRRQNAGIKTPTRVDFGKASGLPSPDGQLPRVGTQFEPDPYEDGMPRKISPGNWMRLPAGIDRLDAIRSPNAMLKDTVARLQLEMEEMRPGSMCHQTLGGRTSPDRPRQVDYRLQFEKMTRKAGVDRSICALALETLAVKAYGDMGHTARHIIQDRFIAGHDSCDLCRHLDSVSPETPIWDIADRCRVWESHADSDARRFSKPGPERALPIYTVDGSGCGRDDWMVAAVTISPTAPDQLETLLRRLLPAQ